MKFNKKVLGNGLTVLHEKRDIPVTTVMLGVKYGSAYESASEKGIAHFIEHLCFKGTKKRTTKQIAFELEKVGGVLNAFTAEEQTAYHVKLPSDYLELAIDVISDIYFNPIFPEKEVEKEGKVICEEIKMYHDSPRMHVLERIKSCLYKDAFGMFGAGTSKTVKSMTRDQLLAKHDELYVPENSILCVVGNNDFEDVVRLAERFCVGRTGKTPERPEISLQIIKKLEKRPGLHQANIALGFHFPFKGDQRYATEVFSVILGQGMSSKLFTEVREKRGLAYSVKTDLDLGKDYSYLLIYIGTDNEKIDEVISICVEEFKKMGNLTLEELEEGKKQVIGGYKVGLEGSDSVALGLILEETLDNAENFYKYPENIKKVDLEDIKNLAKNAEYASFVLSG